MATQQQQGDLIAIDISGHDIIGLGFDVWGNQRDGIFVKSVASRGPAKESGAIQSGDRIQCLNISFEDVTLQDARDLLNCGSPYKMRLLLEKRALPASLITKINQSDSTNCSNNRRQKATKATRPMSFDGTLDATKSYLKKITDRLGSKQSAASGGDQFSGHQHSQDPYALNWHHKSAASLVLANSNCHDGDDPNHTTMIQYLNHPAPLGSVMARQATQMRNSSMAVDELGDAYEDDQEPVESGGHFNRGQQQSDSDVGARECWRNADDDQAADGRQHRKQRAESTGSQSSGSSRRRHKLQGPHMASKNGISDLSQVHAGGSDDSQRGEANRGIKSSCNIGGESNGTSGSRNDADYETTRQPQQQANGDKKSRNQLEHSRSQPEISELRSVGEHEAPKQSNGRTTGKLKPTPPIKPTSQSIADLQSIINSSRQSSNGNHENSKSSSKSQHDYGDSPATLSVEISDRSDG